MGIPMAMAMPMSMAKRDKKGMVVEGMGMHKLLKNNRRGLRM
jgi:hypothetical protein